MTAELTLEARLAAAETRITDLARQKSRLELLNSMLTRLTAVSGLDDVARHVMTIVMETVGAANILLCYKVAGRWKCVGLDGAEMTGTEPVDARVREALSGCEPLRIEDTPVAGVTGPLATETWIFPLICRDRAIGAVVMEQMQLTSETVMPDLIPFFVYAALMLDNEINNYSQLAESHRKLLDSETKFRTIFKATQDAIYLTEASDGRIFDCHDPLSGYTPDELIGKTTLELGLWANPADRQTVVDQLLQQGVVKNFESKFRRKDGFVSSGLISANVMQLNGRPVLLSIVRDVTELKQAEEERRNMEKQLLHAQKLESLGVLAGGIAHDFNNILATIMGNAGLAMMRLDKASPVLENLKQIEQATVRAADLAKQMLAYSGKGKFVVENIDLNLLLEEMLHMLQVSISKKAVLRLNQHRPLPTVEADVTQMRQIIMNLVINASEAIGDRSGVIAISTGCMDCDRSYLKDVWLDENLADGLYVYLEVADSGCGMDSETLSRLFDPFFSTKFTGRGLGMSAVLGIVRGHKGAIKVYSEPGRGSSFKILLPASGKPAELFDQESRSDDWKGSGTVLLVDDEETIRGIGAEMLKELGFRPITANDGNEALAVFSEHPEIALVIMDLTMPHMDGEQCFRRLRQLKPDVKVIMSSGYSEYEVSQKFSGKGLAGFIQKPYKFSELRGVIRGVL